MDKTHFETIKNLVNESPIRKSGHNENRDLFQDERVVLGNVKSVMENLKGEDLKPVNVVIMGEVKSGKSTFVNALIGKEVTKVDVIEATSTIYEVIYDEKHCYDIHFLDGRIQSVFDENEALLTMENASKPGKTQQEIIKVQVRTPVEILKKIHIVDTPGLHTITSENVKITEDYMIHADAILWVINIHHIGQRDVTDEITRCLSYGKPMIALVNRLDELDEDSDSVMAYVEEEMSYLFTKIIPISAKTSWQGVLEANENKIKVGNVREVLTYLQENIADRSVQFIGETSIQTMRTQVARELEIHQNALNKIQQTFEKMKIQFRGLEDNNQKVKKIMRGRTEEIFYDSRVISELESLIRNSSATSEGLSGIITNNRILETHLENAYLKLTEIITKEWVNYYELMIESEKQLHQEELDVMTGQNTILFNYQTAKPSKSKGVNSDVMKMSMATLISTTAMATLFAPPILIGGIFLAGAYLTNNLRNNSNYSEEISYSTARRIMEDAKYRQLPKIVEDMETFSDKYFQKIKNIVAEYYIGEEMNISKLTKIRDEIEEYTNKLTLFGSQI